MLNVSREAQFLGKVPIPSDKGRICWIAARVYLHGTAGVSMHAALVFGSFCTDKRWSNIFRYLIYSRR